MRKIELMLVGAVACVALAGCGSSSDNDGGSGGQTQQQDGGVDSGKLDKGGDAQSEQQSCTVTFTWMQKDAYLDKAGRNMDFWPPHTTTTMQVQCGDEQVANEAMINHGTSPEDKTEAGATILEAVRTENVTTTRAQANKLVSEFKKCECGTEFLSLDALKGDVVKQMVGELAKYVKDNMTCPAPDGVDAVVKALEAGDIDYVVKTAPSCSWTTGESWAEGFDTAVRFVAASANKQLQDYHVCNNDAKLQAKLWAAFQKDALVTPCNVDDNVCHGPTWFYTP